MGITRLPNGVTVGGPALTIGPDGQPSMPGYKVALNPEGGYTATKNNWLQDVGVPLGVAGIFGYGAFGPGGYASLAGSGAPASSNLYPVANSAPNLGALVAPAGAHVGAFGTGTLANFFDSRGGTAAIQAGSQLLSGVLAAHAQGKATAAQVAQAQAALDFAKQQYATAQQQNAPYLAMSQAALPNLQAFANRTPASMTTQGPYGTQLQPYDGAQGPPPSLSSLIPVGSGQTPAAAANAAPATGGTSVTLRAPTGETRAFAANDPQVPQLLARGAQRVA